MMRYRSKREHEQRCQYKFFQCLHADQVRLNRASQWGFSVLSHFYVTGVHLRRQCLKPGKPLDLLARVRSLRAILKFLYFNFGFIEVMKKLKANQLTFAVIENRYAQMTQ